MFLPHSAGSFPVPVKWLSGLIHQCTWTRLKPVCWQSLVASLTVSCNCARYCLRPATGRGLMVSTKLSLAAMDSCTFHPVNQLHRLHTILTECRHHKPGENQVSIRNHQRSLAIDLDSCQSNSCSNNFNV